MIKPHICVDFNAMDYPEKGYISLQFFGSIKDLLMQKVKLVNGLEVTVYDNGEGDMMEMDGTAVYLTAMMTWYAKLDNKSFRRIPIPTNYDRRSIDLNCFHCGILIKYEDFFKWGGLRGFNSRCKNCGGVILESILPPKEETA